MNYYLAIDIGASSGRHIVGWKEQGELKTEEVFRFPNQMQNDGLRLTWDIDALNSNVLEGIKAAFAKYPSIESLSIDTWGVDYVLLKGDEEVRPVYAYRDNRTLIIPPELHARISFAELYRRTGCQFQTFNSIYQLCVDHKQDRFRGVTDLLMMPEYLMYKLCGVKAREYTDATTMGMVNVETGEFDEFIIDQIKLPKQLFPKLQKPGTVLGELLPEVQEKVGGNCKVVLCATHDTASAVEGIPMEGNHPYISSGTWSLLGVKTEKAITDDASRESNYSNEGGVGYNRYQKNIMGMWLANELKRELCPDWSFPQIVEAAEASSCTLTIDASSEDYLSPESMKAAFDAATDGQLKDIGDYFRCAYQSLADSYRVALADLEQNTGKQYEKLYIVGGGAKNAFLNRLTEEACGKQVIALPIEATALGNLTVQMKRGE